MKKISLEEYQKEVKRYLKKYKISSSNIKNLMKICEEDIEYAYNKNWEPIEIALPISMGL